MNKMSGMGFAIVIVILIGLGMIISTPTLIDNTSNGKSETLTQAEDLSLKLQAFENRINERLNSLENNRNQSNDRGEQISNKYICTIEGNVDENGNVVSVDVSNRYTKFLFVCEYRP